MSILLLLNSKGVLHTFISNYKCVNINKSFFNLKKWFMLEKCVKLFLLYCVLKRFCFHTKLCTCLSHKLAFPCFYFWSVKLGHLHIVWYQWENINYSDILFCFYWIFGKRFFCFNEIFNWTSLYNKSLQNSSMTYSRRIDKEHRLLNLFCSISFKSYIIWHSSTAFANMYSMI